MRKKRKKMNMKKKMVMIMKMKKVMNMKMKMILLVVSILEMLISIPTRVQLLRKKYQKIKFLSAIYLKKSSKRRKLKYYLALLFSIKMFLVFT